MKRLSWQILLGASLLGLSIFFYVVHYLIFKEMRAREINKDQEKSFICLDAQKKFFTNHLYPAAKKIAESILVATDNSFYKEMSEDFLEFLEQEKAVLGGEL